MRTRGSSTLSWLVALALVLSSVRGLAQEAKPLPPDCVGYIYTENLSALTLNINTFVGTVLPGFSALASPQFHLGMAIKNPSLRGIDQNRPASIVFLNPKTYPEWAALLLSVTDPSESLAGMAPAVTDKGETEGVHTLSFTEFNKRAFDKATPEQRQNFQQFNVQRNLYAGFVEKTMVLSQDAVTCRTVKGWLTGGLLDISKSATAKGDLIGCANVKALMAIYEPEIDKRVAPFLKQLEVTVQAAQTAGKPQMGAMNPAAVAKILKLEIDALVSLARQMDTLEFGVDLRPEGARGRLLASFKPETPAERFIAAQVAFKPGLVGFLPSDAAVLAEAGIVFTPELQDFYMSLIESIYGMSEQPPDPTQKANALKLYKEAITLYSGKFAFALTTPSDGRGGITIISVKKCADPAKERKLLDDIMSPEGPIQNMYLSSLGMKMNIKRAEKAEVIDGVQVSALEIDLGEQPPAAIEAMKLIYGYPMKMWYGMVQDMLVFGFGKDVANQFGKVIALIKKGGGDALEAPDIRPLMEAFPPEVNGFVAINPTPLIASFQALATLPGAAPGAEPLPPPPMVTAGAIGIYSRMSGRTMTIEGLVPMELILSLKDAVMMGGLGPMGGPGPGPRPRPRPQGAPPAGGVAPEAQPKAPAPAPAPKPAPKPAAQ